MLKLNSTGGKLDITISDDTVFGTSRKSTVKQPQTRAVASRASIPHKKQQIKHAHPAEKGQKGKESRQLKSIKKGPVLKQTKPQSRQGHKVEKSKVSTTTTRHPVQAGSTGSSVITQDKLDSILSLLNIAQGNGTATSLSPEQLSVLVTSFGKVKSTEPQDNQQPLQPQSNIVNDQSTIAKEIPPSTAVENGKQERQAGGTRTQWKKELDEQVALKKKAKALERKKEDDTFVEYNPWGRPGGGAPIRSQSGKVLADYHSRAAKEHPEKTSQEATSSSALHTSVSRHGPTMVKQTHPTGPIATMGSPTSNIDTAVPVALRSSFAIGAPGLVSNDTQQKRHEELKWKQKLEKQIEEKKERQRQRKVKEEQEDLLNLSWNNKHTSTAAVAQETVNRHNAPSNQPRGNGDIQKHVTSPQQNITQTTQDQPSPLNASLNGSMNRTHVRGFGMHSMDPQTKGEADQKRLKVLEHQRAIQEQVEENRRRKQQEKEQRLKEEAMEEARLSKERELLNQAFAIEQKKKKEKEEEAKRASEALQQSVLDAHEAAQQAKMEKRRKHLEAGGHTTTRGVGNSSRSFVVSRSSSLAHHAVPDSISSGQDNRHASHDNRHSILSNYATPRVTGRDTPKVHGVSSKASHSRNSKIELFVPPLNLVRGDSPPIPTLRNKAQKTKPAQHRSTTSASVEDRLHRTVSSHSEPCDGSMALSTRKDTLRKELEDVLSSEEFTSTAFIAGGVSVSLNPLDDAFMIPFHRTDSATLPALPETPEDNTPTRPISIKRGNMDKKTTKKIPAKGSTVTPMYRSPSSHLKSEKVKTEVSPRKTKGIRQTAKPGLSPRGAANRSVKDSSTTRSVSQLKSKQDVDRTKRQTKDKISPRMDALSRLSAHQEVAEPLPTARQEMILQQLAALRQGLILKERELKQELHS